MKSGARSLFVGLSVLSGALSLSLQAGASIIPMTSTWKVLAELPYSSSAKTYSFTGPYSVSSHEEEPVYAYDVNSAIVPPFYSGVVVANSQLDVRSLTNGFDLTGSGYSEGHIGRGSAIYQGRTILSVVNQLDFRFGVDSPGLYHFDNGALGGDWISVLDGGKLLTALRSTETSDIYLSKGHVYSINVNEVVPDTLREGGGSQRYFNAAVSAVPEPASLAVMAIGGLALASCRSRRRAQG